MSRNVLTTFAQKYLFLQQIYSERLLIQPRPLHIGPEKSENTALFLRLGLTSALIRHENGALRKCSLNRRNLKTSAFHFREDGEHFANETFSHVISLTEFLRFQIPPA